MATTSARLHIMYILIVRQFPVFQQSNPLSRALQQWFELSIKVIKTASAAGARALFQTPCQDASADILPRPPFTVTASTAVCVVVLLRVGQCHERIAPHCNTKAAEIT